MALPSEAAAPAYTIRRLRVGDRADRENLFRFIATAWSPDSWHMDHARWDWQFRAVPTATAAEPPLLVFARGDEILGQVGVIPIELCVRGERRPAAYAFDIMVLREYWNRGAFPLLMREFCRLHPIALGLGMNKKAYALFSALKWIDIGLVPRLECYRSWRSIASGTTLVALVRQARHAVRALLPARAPADLAVRTVARFGDDVTALWDRTVGDRIAVRRTAAWLNWRYGEQPLLAYERLVIERNGAVVGCAVVRVDRVGRERVGLLVECFAEPALLERVAAAAVRRLRERGVHRITADVLDPATETALARLGFVRRRSGIRLMIRVADAALAGAMADRAHWYITRGDADQDRPR